MRGGYVSLTTETPSEESMGAYQVILPEVGPVSWVGYRGIRPPPFLPPRPRRGEQDEHRGLGAECPTRRTLSRPPWASCGLDPQSTG